MIGVTVLGSTGSIGVSTLDVLARHPHRYRVVALTAHRDWRRMTEQCLAFRPELAVMVDPQAAAELERTLAAAGVSTRVAAGAAALEEAAALPEVASVMAAIVGGAGLPPTLAAARAGKRVLLANKEALVMAGRLLMEEVAASGAELLPIDSEHNAIFQCMPAGFRGGLAPIGVEKILLTASGGPFRSVPLAELERVTPDEACNHPNWEMGRKISVDSATMMNKGLEVIEAHWLFGASPEQIEVVIHPQSMIHSLVQYNDGSVLAELGNPDMRTPIAHALAWPDRIASGVEPLDLVAVGRLDFEAPDLERFACLRLAFEALRAGGSASVVLNAANEVAVAAFLHGRLGFLGIPAVIEETLQRVEHGPAETLEEIHEFDRRARRVAEELVSGMVESKA